MREIEYTGKFKKDLKRERKGLHGKTLEADLMSVLEALVTDKPLPSKMRDHALSNNWHGSRDCHLKPDLVLIYQKPDEHRLVLVRLGSHAELKL